MRVALCLSGEFRTFFECYHTLKKYVIDELNPDIFIHTWDNLGSSLYSKRQGIDTSFEHNKLDIQKVIKLLNPKHIIVENYEHWFNKLDSKYNAGKNEYGSTIPMFYKIFECNKLKKQYETQNNFEYDLVIRTRPDLIYYKHIPELYLNGKYFWHLNCPSFYNYWMCHDILNISSSKNIDLFSTIYDKLPELWNDNRGGLPRFYGTRCMKLHLLNNGIPDSSFDDRSVYEIYRSGRDVINYGAESDTIYTNMINKIYDIIDKGIVNYSQIQQIFSKNNELDMFNIVFDWMIKNNRYSIKDGVIHG